MYKTPWSMVFILIKSEGKKMNNIKTIADFKRAMLPGTFWYATHRYTDNNPTPKKYLGLRECGLNNSVDFGFKTGKAPNGSISHCSWPKKSQFSTIDNGNTVVIKTSFCELTYTQKT